MGSQHPKKRLVAIRNFDEQLYRLVKTYASLEGRTVASIIEEAVRHWMSSRGDYGEVLEWTRLEEEYEENFRAFEREADRISSERGEGYVLVCGGRVRGVFDSYYEAAERAAEACEGHALIVKIPYRKAGEVELGLPW